MPSKLKEDFKNSLREAGVPITFWNKRLTDLGASGEFLRSYLRSDEYKLDRGTGIVNRGILLWGDYARRFELLGTLAKEMVLANDGVYFTNLISVFYFVENNDNSKFDMARVPALFISGFYDSSLDSPTFNPYDRAKIESFISSRCNNGKRNYLSSSLSLDNAAWWSEDFRSFMSSFTREYSVVGGRNGS